MGAAETYGGLDKEAGKLLLNDRVEALRNVIAAGKERDFSEDDVSSKFILPLLKSLGWGIDNIDEVKEQRRTLTGPVDYSLQIDKKPKLLLELKKLTEDLDGYREVRGRKETFPEQATHYGWYLKVEWVILTNFKEIRLYNSYYKNPPDGLRLRLRYDDYHNNFDLLWLLSRESVSSGELDKIERKAERKNIDQAILEDLLEIRSILTLNIRKNDSSINLELVRQYVQRIMDRLLVLRVAEDRGVMGFESLNKELSQWKARDLPTPFMGRVKTLFREFDESYDTKLFEPDPCEDIKIDNTTLERVIDLLYQYNFDLLDADVLGAIYEDYIGRILRETENKGIQISESPEVKKREGIYYTPTYLAEYIVRGTLGEVLKNCRSPDEVSRIKIIDPACGSGSFLIKAFDVVKEWYLNYNDRLEKENKSSLDSHVDRVIDLDRRILRDNLFGVDIDAQAGEIASVNLTLKALRRGERLPPILGQNIRVGNSLVDGSESDFGKLSERTKTLLRPFDWKVSFPDVFQSGGFDVVIGNPPYFKVRKDNPIRVSRSFKAIQSGPVNSAMMFIDRATELTKPNGFLGLVLPKMLTYTKGWRGARSRLFPYTLKSLIDCQEAFEGVLLEQILLVVQKSEVLPEAEYSVGGAKGTVITTSKMRIPQKLARDEDFMFLELHEIAYALRRKMLEGTEPLGKICNIILGEGIQSYPCWRESPKSGDLPILRGDDVQIWHLRGSLFFSPHAPELAPFRDEMAQLHKPHIVAQRIVAHIRNPCPHIILMATYDSRGSFAFNTAVHFLVTDARFDHRYILALLNSKLFSYYAYKFIYNNAVRSMDFYKDYAERLPIRPVPKSKQEYIGRIVDRILDHFGAGSRTSPVYRKYLTEKITSYSEFGDYYRKLDPTFRDPRDATTEGSIRQLEVIEKGDWLSFQVEYVDTSRHRIVSNHEVLRCRFPDRAIRTFLALEITRRGPSAKGKRILDKILAARVPAFSPSHEKNLELVRKQLGPYLNDYDNHRKWEEEYETSDGLLNQVVYNIYGLSQEETQHVETNSRRAGWHVD